MLKVLTVIDKKNTAIDRLAKGNIPYFDNLDYVICDVHPKRPDPEQLERFEREAKDADIIDFQYFRTALMLLDRYDWLKDKKKILAHYNPYSLNESDWKQFDKVVAPNETIWGELKKIRPDAEYIPITVDTDFWTYNLGWEKTNSVIMVANRIESKKGILPVAIACGELGLRFTLVGAISDQNYFYDIQQTGVLDFHEQVSNERLRELYHKSAIFVVNSVDNFESGTMPFLEAGLCGVPVLARQVGHIPDIYNGENMIVQDCEVDDVLGIKEKLEDMIDDTKKLEELRDKLWNSVKGYSNERRAFMYQRLYRQVVSDKESVSVIMPIYERKDIIKKSITAVLDQDYPNLELIVIDDHGELESLVKEVVKSATIPVRYIDNSNGDYGLARARNKGIVEATGNILVFCDERMVMQPDAISEFVKNLTPKTWLYGNKGVKKEFVENFSCVYRQELITAGMFNERINKYGGMSQEIRDRIKYQSFRTQYVETAKAHPTGKSSNRNRKRSDIIKMKNLIYKLGL